VRATECFLRDLILRIAPRAVYVTSKYDRSTQIAINGLISQLKQSGKSKAINEKNKLIVIHNYRDVNTYEDLLNRIDDVKRTYVKDEQEEEEQIWENESSDEEDKLNWANQKQSNEEEVEPVPWLPTEMNGYFYYQTPKTIHIFLVNDNAPETNELNPKEYNNKAIDTILNTITGNDQPVKVNLIQEVLKNGQALLQKYIRDWDEHRLFLRKEEEGHRIMPGMKSGNNDDEDEDLNYWEVKDTFKYDEKYWVTPFHLPKIKFTDTGVISGSFHELNGEMYHINAKNEKFIIFHIHLPGFDNNSRNKDSIKVETDKDKKTLKVFVKLSKIDPPKGFEKGSDGFPVGIGVFNYDLETQDLRYIRPQPKELYTDKHMKIENGVLKITLVNDCENEDEEDEED